MQSASRMSANNGLCVIWAIKTTGFGTDSTYEAGGSLYALMAQHYRKRYRDLLQEAEKECPAPDEAKQKGRFMQSREEKALSTQRKARLRAPTERSGLNY